MNTIKVPVTLDMLSRSPVYVSEVLFDKDNNVYEFECKLENITYTNPTVIVLFSAVPRFIDVVRDGYTMKFLLNKSVMKTGLNEIQLLLREGDVEKYSPKIQFAPAEAISTSIIEASEDFNKLLDTLVDLEVSEAERVANELARQQTINDLQASMGVTVATLGTDGKLSPSQIPAISVTDTFTMTNISQMTGLVAQKGDMALLLEGGVVKESYILAGTSTVLSDWKKLGVGYVAEAGHATTASTADNATRINGYTVVTLTQAQYDAIVKDNNTIYLVVG